MGALSDIAVRSAAADDIAALHRLIERAYRGDDARQGWTHEADLLGGQRTDEAALSDMLGDPGQRMLVAEQDRALLGCVQVIDRGRGLAYLGLLSVDPQRQATGTGRALITAAEDVARTEFGATRMEMTVIGTRAALIDWYERRGYHATGERRPFEYPAERLTDTDLTFVVMGRAL